MDLLATLIADRGYANYDLEGPSPKHRYVQQYVVTIYERDGTVAWTLRGTTAELQAMIATLPRAGRA